MIEGAIRKPGVYSCDGNPSLPELVQQAGGYHVRGWAVVMAASIARRGETIRIDLRKTPKEEQDVFSILPGDIVKIIQSMGL